MSGALVAGGLAVVPAVAVAAPAGAAPPPSVSTPLTRVTPRGPSGTTAALTAAPTRRVSWPPAVNGVASLAATARSSAARSSAVPAGSTGYVAIAGSPVAVGPLDAVTVADPRAMVAPRTVTAAEVRVEVLGQDVAAAVGVTGVMMRLSNAGAATTGPTGAALRVDYAAFAGAAGGDFGGRLRIVRVPACAVTTPSVASCRVWSELPTVNDAGTQTVSAQVPLADPTGITTGAAAPATVVAVAAVGSSDNGTFARTSFTESSHWQAGSSGGSFDWGYPMRVPPAPGGLQPTVSLSYSSSSEDGRTNATNYQGSWVGEGWEYQPGYIERSYRSCTDDVTDVPAIAPAYQQSTGDQCWRDDNATIVWNGHSTELIRSGTTWRLGDDDGSRIEKLTGAPNGDNDGEYWRVTTTGGTRFYFGLNRLPNWTAGQRETLSAWNVPVYANRSTEPCYSTSGLAASHCNQAWRWNLDYVVDSNGNTMSYFYGREQARTGLQGAATPTVVYDRGGYVDHIEYGTTYGHELDTTNPPLKVVFGALDRCTTSSCGTHDATNWPDTPWDLNCATTATSCPSNVGPSYWITKRLASVTTQYWTGAGYQDVDRWDLGAGWQDVGYLLLTSITHTGKVGGSMALPAITFGYTLLHNRTDATATNGISVANHARVTSVVSETGGQLLITYEASDCTPTNVPTSTPSQNSMRCFPQYWKPPTQPAGWGWWNKYRVSSVVERDLVGGQPDVVHSYTYSTAGSSTTVLWHHAAGSAVWSTPGSKKSWSDFRGWPTVTVTTGATGQVQSSVTTLYFRGMNGDDTSTGEANRSVTATDGWGDPAVADDDWLAGRVLQQTTSDGPGGHELTSTVTDPWVTQTGVRVEDPDHAYPSHSYAYLTGDARVRTRTWIPSSSTWRSTERDLTHEPTYGLITATVNKGDLATTADDTCTTTSFAQSTTGTTPDGATTFLIDFPAQEVVSDCTPSPAPANILGGRQTLYDDTTVVGAAPTRGLATTSLVLASYTGTTPVWAQEARYGYDTRGRAVRTYDALDRLTTTGYTPATGAPVTATTSTNPAGFVTTTTLEPAWGSPLTITDANGHVTTGTYDPLGEVAKVWLPGRATNLTPNAQYAYTEQGSTAASYITSKVLGPTGTQVTSYQIYDGLLRSRQTQTPAPDANGGRMVSDTAYDSRGEVVKTSTFWNSASAPSSTLGGFTDATVANQNRYTYDGAGRRTAQQLWSLGTMKWQTLSTYDGTSVTTTPPAGGTASTTFTSVTGKTTLARQFVGAIASGTHQDATYTYDRMDRLVTVLDPAGNTWSWGYDRRGRQTSESTPDSGLVTKTYDAAGQLTSSVDARGVTVSYAIDNLGRTTAEWLGAVTTGTQLTSYLYDTLAKGQLTSSTRYSGGSAYTTAVTSYDPAYRPLGTAITLPASEGTLAGTYTTADTYNVDGSLATQSVPAAGDLSAETVTTSYDTSGHATTIGGAASYLSGTSYYPWGDTYQRLLGTGSNRIRLTNVVDEATGRLSGSSVETEHPGTPNTFDEQRTDAYGYSPSGAATSHAEQKAGATVSNECFLHDGLQRLIQAWTTTAATCQASPTAAVVAGPDSYWTTWTYDTVGDRASQVQHSGAGDTTTTYTYPTPGTAKATTLTSTATTSPGGPSSATYQYDAAGDTTQRNRPGSTEVLTWDAERHLATQTINGQTTSYVYDASGNRLLRKEPNGTVTAYLGSQEIRKSSTGALTGTRFYGSVATRTGSGLTWLADDAHGTADVAINPTTLAVTTRRFQPFGEVRGNAPAWADEHGFVGGTTDPTGLTHLGAREYDPTLGRFVSLDPKQDLAAPQQWNGYSYADNDPASGADPSGLMRMNESGGGGTSGCDATCQRYGSYYQGLAAAYQASLKPAAPVYVPISKNVYVKDDDPHYKKMQAAYNTFVQKAHLDPNKIGPNQEMAIWYQICVAYSQNTCNSGFAEHLGELNSPGIMGMGNDRQSEALAHGGKFFVGSDFADTGGAAIIVIFGYKYNPTWNAQQRAAADEKIRAYNAGQMVVSVSDRSGPNLRTQMINGDMAIDPGEDADHIIDLQLGGPNSLDNAQALDASVNRSLGSQTAAKIRQNGLKPGDTIGGATISDAGGDIEILFDEWELEDLLGEYGGGGGEGGGGGGGE